MTARPDLAAYLLAALVVVCATVLIALGRDVPDALWILAGAAAGGGAGASLPARKKSS